MAAGLVALALPGLTALVLLTIIAGWALVTAACKVASAIRLRRVIEHEWLLISSGLASMLFGMVVLVAPGAGAPALGTLFGSYALGFGLLQVGLVVRLHRLARVLRAAPGSPPPGGLVRGEETPFGRVRLGDRPTPPCPPAPSLRERGGVTGSAPRPLLTPPPPKIGEGDGG